MSPWTLKCLKKELGKWCWICKLVIVKPSPRSDGDERPVGVSWGENKKWRGGTFLVVQWLSCWAPHAGGLGSTPGQGTRFHMPQLKSPCAATKTSAAKIIKEGDVKQVWLCIATFKNAQHVTASWQFGQCSAGGGGGVISGGRLEGQGRRHQQVHWPPFPTRPVAEAGCHPGALGLPATWWLRSEDKSWGRARHDPYCLWWPSLRSHIVSLLPILFVEYGKVPSRLKRGRKRLFPMMWRTCETRPTAVPFSGNNTFH